MDYKYVTARKAGDYLLARNVHDMVGITGDPRILILDGLTPCGVSVECRVSCVSSFRGTSFWSARFVRVVYLMVDNTTLHILSSPDCLMVAPCAIQPREPGQPRGRV